MPTACRADAVRQGAVPAVALLRDQIVAPRGPLYHLLEIFDDAAGEKLLYGHLGHRSRLPLHPRHSKKLDRSHPLCTYWSNSMNGSNYDPPHQSLGFVVASSLHHAVDPLMMMIVDFEDWCSLVIFLGLICEQFFFPPLPLWPSIVATNKRTKRRWDEAYCTVKKGVGCGFTGTKGIIYIFSYVVYRYTHHVWLTYYSYLVSIESFFSLSRDIIE